MFISTDKHRFCLSVSLDQTWKRHPFSHNQRIPHPTAAHSKWAEMLMTGGHCSIQSYQDNVSRLMALMIIDVLSFMMSQGFPHLARFGCRPCNARPKFRPKLLLVPIGHIVFMEAQENGRLVIWWKVCAKQTHITKYWNFLNYNSDICLGQLNFEISQFTSNYICFSFHMHCSLVQALKCCPPFLRILICYASCGLPFSILHRLQDGPTVGCAAPTLHVQRTWLQGLSVPNHT